MKIVYFIMVFIPFATSLKGQLATSLQIKNRATVYARPDSASEHVGYLKKGTIVAHPDTEPHQPPYLNKQHFWVAVKYNSTEGFVHSASVINAVRLYYPNRAADDKSRGQQFYGIWKEKNGCRIKKVNAKIRVKTFKTELIPEGCYRQKVMLTGSRKKPPMMIIGSPEPLKEKFVTDCLTREVSAAGYLTQLEMDAAIPLIDGYVIRQNHRDLRLLFKGDIDNDLQPDLVLYECADFGCLHFLLLTKTASKGQVFALADIFYEPNLD